MDPADLLDSLFAPETPQGFLDIPAFGVLLSGAPAYGHTGNIAVGAFLVDAASVRAKLSALSDALPFASSRELLTQLLAPVRARSICDGWGWIARGIRPEPDPDGRVSLFFSEITAGAGAEPFAWISYTPRDSEAYERPSEPAMAWRRILEASGLRCGDWPVESARRFAAGHAILPEVVSEAFSVALSFAEEAAVSDACTPPRASRPPKL